MPQLRFKKQFIARILDGSKTATLRRWRDCRLTSGKRIFSEGVGWLIIDGVDRVEWKSLTHADAKADGFASMAELTDAINEIYPNQRGDGKHWFRVRFHCESAGTPPLAKTPETSFNKTLGKRTPKKTRSKSSRADQNQLLLANEASEIVSAARLEFAGRVRAELDKAVRANGS